MDNMAVPLTIKLLRDEAARFRNAIERCERSLPTHTFETFPRGSCGDVAMLLGAFLIDKGFGTFEYISGERGEEANGNWHTHAWIEGGGFIIDITADQFAEVTDSVLVLPVGDSHWHRTFEQARGGAANYRLHSGFTQAELNAAYRTIIKELSDCPL